MSAVVHRKVSCESDGWISLTADQWTELRRAQETAGARALAYAVIGEAWSMATRVLRPLSPGPHSKFVRRKHRIERAAQQEAIAWFSRDGIAPFSFLFLCRHLDLDPGSIRRALAAEIDRADQWASPSLARLGT
jgi:hypothetical protein